MSDQKKVSSKTKAKGFVSGFKAFISKGNIVDLAVGVVIGGAFGKIITALVNQIILPPVGLLIGDKNFSELVWELKPAVLEVTDGAGNIVVAGKDAVNIGYGIFIQTIIEFLIIAFAIYVVVMVIIRRKEYNDRLYKMENPDPIVEKEPVIPEDILLLREIRDSLKK